MSSFGTVDVLLALIKQSFEGAIRFQIILNHMSSSLDCLRLKQYSHPGSITKDIIGFYFRVELPTKDLKRDEVIAIVGIPISQYCSIVHTNTKWQTFEL